MPSWLLPKVVVFILVFQSVNWQISKAATGSRPSSTHYGRQFVLGFTAQPHNQYLGYNEIMIFATFDTYVNISVHKSSKPLFKNSVFIKAGHVLKFTIPASLSRMHSTMKDNKGISVTATEDVAVFCLNHGVQTSDSYLALPTNVLGTKYVVASYAPSLGKANMAFISPQDNTGVRIILNTKGVLKYNGRLYRSGQTIYVKLNRLETFHLVHHSDLSGTIVEADKPITVLSGATCARIHTRYCDKLVEFLLPVHHWGTEFVVATTGKMTKNGGDLFRVFAFENDTRVRSGSGVRLLNSGNFTEYNLRNRSSFFFECSKPCQVVQYTKGYLNTQGQQVDSALIVVPSIDKFLNTYKVFLSGERKDSFQHSITLLVKTSEKDGLVLNGKRLTGLSWQNIDGTKYSWTILHISNGVTISHTSRNVLFGLLVFGAGNFESHGYPGGFTFGVLRKHEPVSWSRWEGWSDCTVSCDNGQQTRRRSCVGRNLILNDVTRCHGKSSETRACSTWKCPDCNKPCKTGKLNSACDTCICNDNTLTGTVKNNDGVLLDNATIVLSEFPFKILATTDTAGHFTLKGVCISEEYITVSRHGYLSQKIKTTKLNPTQATVTAYLKKIVFPEINSHPESKLRLEGQAMTLCCGSISKPRAQFEWMINNRAADEYQHDGKESSKLIIPRVSRNMSGEIKCRVYNDNGAEFSNPAKITVLDAIDDSCDSAPSERIITLPQGCVTKEKNSATVDVGQCHKEKCIARALKNMNNCKDNFCCRSVATKKIKVDCLRYSFDLTRVTKCGCGDCIAKKSVVKGVARGGPENTPFKYGYIYHGEKYLTRTGRKGDFSFKVPGDLTRLVVTFKDKRGYNNFQDLTKVIPLVPGREAYVEVRMKLRPEPVIVNATDGFQIPLGNSGTVNQQGDTARNKQSSPAVALSLPPQSLITEDGKIYNGMAKVEVSFVDPRNATQVEEADGDFSTLSEDGESEQLETFGVLKMDFKDENGKRLQPNAAIDVLFDLDEYNITEKEAEDVKLWYMDEKTGRWRIMDTGLKQHKTRRSKRSGRQFYFGTIDRNYYKRFVNLDKLARRCHVKVKVEDANTEEFQTAQVTVLATQNNLYRYKDYSVKPNEAQCLETFCTGDLATIRAILDGKYLMPNETAIDDDVNSKHAIAYYRSMDAVDRFSNRITIEKLTDPLSALPSPFYSDLSSCENSPEGDSFFFEAAREQRAAISSEDVESFNENWYPDLEASVCYVKITVENIDDCSNKIASFHVQSAIGKDSAGNIVVTMTESKSSACAEYKCPESDDHDIMVKVVPLAPGNFVKGHPATQKFIADLNPTILEVFSFKPEYDVRKPKIGILHSDEKVFTDDDMEKNEKRAHCMQERIKAGVRFRCT